MEYRPFGRTGLNVSAIGFGCWEIAGTYGAVDTTQFNNAVADLVAFLQWMGEPTQNDRVRLGVWVLLFLGVFTVIAWRLNAAFWKDVK